MSKPIRIDADILQKDIVGVERQVKQEHASSGVLGEG